MFTKKSLVLLVTLLSISVLGVALFSPSESLRIKKLFEEQSYNSISGREGQDGPVLVVKIDDTRMAHPQIGVEYADVVYIEQVEGGLTRLAAIYSSVIPREIGPIRSARISDLELIAQYGKVGFAYSGAQSKLGPEIESANLFDLGAQSMSSTIYTTDSLRTPPYAMVLRADLLMEYALQRGYEFSISKGMGWNFSDETELGLPIDSAKIEWPASSYEARWSEKRKVWELNHNGSSNVSSTGSILTADTFVIQIVSITDSIYKDKVGGITPFSATVGTGRGFILRDGKYIEGTWTRLSEESGTTWRTRSGEEIPFSRGKLWVALTDKEPTFTLHSEDAGDSRTK
jgi:hypothetical protein